MILNDGYPYIVISGSTSGTTLAVTSIANGPIVPPMMVGGLNVPANLMINQQLTGPTGGVGTYQLSVAPSPAIASQTMLVAPWTLSITDTIVSQYANSPIMLSLLNAMNVAVDPKANLFNFYNFVWNVNTASGYGLSVWGRIVNVGRNIVVPMTNAYFQWKETGVGTPFGPGGSTPFYNGGTTSTQGTWALSDTLYRQLILVKAIANISVCSAQVINYVLQTLFGAGTCYCADLGNMAMSINFANLTTLDFYLIANGKALPRPAGVSNFIYSGFLLGQNFMFSESGSYSAPFGYGSIGPSYAGGTFFNGLFAPVSY